MLRTQGDKRVGLHVEAGLQAELKMAIKQDRHDEQILQGEVIADATAQKIVGDKDAEKWTREYPPGWEPKV